MEACARTAGCIASFSGRPSSLPVNTFRHTRIPNNDSAAVSAAGSRSLAVFRSCRRQTSGSARKTRPCQAVGGVDSPPWTLDQIAGLAFGAFLVLSVYLAKEVDVIVARSQRRDLGLCEECGGLFDAATCEEWRCPQKLNS